jgi:hemoglobin
MKPREQGVGSDYERLGGEAGLKKLVSAFVGRVWDDFIIGFLFEGRDRQALEQREYEFAAAHLGGPVAYSGRPLGQVHKPLKINDGHFRRRMAILKTVLREHSVPEAIIERWLTHDGKLRALITTGEDCVDDSSFST